MISKTTAAGIKDEYLYRYNKLYCEHESETK